MISKCLPNGSLALWLSFTQLPYKELSGWEALHIPMEVDLAYASGGHCCKVFCPLMARPCDIIDSIRAVLPTEARFDFRVEIKIISRNGILPSQPWATTTMGEAMFGSKAFLFCVPKGRKESPMSVVEAYLLNPFVVEYRA